jgi:hypothetical protein
MCCAVSPAVRKGNGKTSDPTPALLSLPGMNPEAVKKLRKRKVTSVAGAQPRGVFPVHCTSKQSISTHSFVVHMHLVSPSTP